MPNSIRRNAALCGAVYGLSLASGEAVSRRPSPPSMAAAARCAAPSQNQAPTVHALNVIASRYRFDPAHIEVFQDDLIAIDMRTNDIAHSFTMDGYRIAKRVGPGQEVKFEFRADRVGTFPYYCNLQIEDGCRRMRGELVVKPRS